MATRTTSNQPFEAAKTVATATDTAADTAKKATKAAAESNADVSGENVSSATDDVLHAVVAGQTEAVQAVESTGHAMLEGMAKVQQEVVDFVSTRIRHDMETQQEFLRCRNFDDLQEVQTRFVQTAMEQYAAKSKQLMQLGSEVVQRSAERNA
jgi:hypothetical protein